MPDAVTMTLDEAAAFLRKHPNTLARLTKEGRVPGQKIGGEWCYLKSALVDFLSKPMNPTEEYAETADRG